MASPRYGFSRHGRLRASAVNSRCETSKSRMVLQSIFDGNSMEMRTLGSRSNFDVKQMDALPKRIHHVSPRPNFIPTISTLEQHHVLKFSRLNLWTKQPANSENSCVNPQLLPVDGGSSYELHQQPPGNPSGYPIDVRSALVATL
jgi:hypothetical protein